jgi:hypothetical protein
MKQWLSDLWYDPAKFTACARSLLFALGTVPEIANLGSVGGKAWYIGKALQIGALAMRAGDRNQA